MPFSVRTAESEVKPVSEEVNPFRAPPSDIPEALPYPAPTNTFGLAKDFYTRDGELYVQNRTQLPMFCVESGVPITKEDMKVKEFHYCSPWVYLLLLLNLIVLLVVYFVVRKSCSVGFGLAPEIRQKYKKRFLYKCLFAAVSVTVFVVSAILEFPIGVVVGGVASLIALFLSVVGNLKFRVTGHEGGTFSFKGCSRDFLDQVERLEHAERAVDALVR